MESQDRELLRAIDRKVDAIQEESETYVAERSEVLARLEALRSDFEETRADVKAIATKIWRGNGGSSILERRVCRRTTRQTYSYSVAPSLKSRCYRKNG